MDTHAHAHGKARIQRRTALHHHDVIEFISGNAFVALGTTKRNDRVREYLLFYSVPDNAYKIAVVTSDRKTVITVLDDSRQVHLIEGFAPITRTQRQSAHLRMKDFLKKVSVLTIVPRALEDVWLVLSVSESGTIVYAHDLGLRSVQVKRTLQRIVRAYQPQLASELRSARNAAHPGSRLRFHLKVRTPSGIDLEQVTLKPETLENLLRTPA